MAQTPTSLSVKKELGVMDEGVKMEEKTDITDHDLGAIWQAVKRDDAVTAATSDCEKIRVDVSEAKDLVINAKPDQRESLLLSFFDKKRSEVQCYTPQSTNGIDRKQDELRLKKCLVEYSTWSSDPLKEAIPHHVVVSDVDAFNAHWMSTHDTERSPCRQNDLWATTPRVKMMPSTSKAKTAPTPR